MSEAETSVTHIDSNIQGDRFGTRHGYCKNCDQGLKNSRRKGKNIITAWLLVCVESYLTLKNEKYEKKFGVMQNKHRDESGATHKDGSV